jgi:monofunctional biosynthetic peptidoglycan transglycosylase
MILAAALLVAALFARAATLPDPAELAHATPTTTALMALRAQAAEAARRRWAPRRLVVELDAVAPVLLRAVVLAEDARFFTHHGLDGLELRASLEKNLEEGRYARGGSTITQQLVKNVYLGPEKSLLRKLDEALLAVAAERALSKARILELYVNVVEWGDGVFGIEAAARHHLGKSAGAVEPHEAALLAAMLPAPRRASLDRPSPGLVARARRVLTGLRDARLLDAAAHARERELLDRRLGRPIPAEDDED